MPRRKASSGSSRTRSRAATSSRPPSGPARRPGAAELARARGRRLRDVIRPGLKVLFCGINPGLYSGATGHHFARPGNRFWRALHAAGFTPRLLHPSEQSLLLEHGYGITNLVSRTTAAADELSPEEFVAGRRRLMTKLRRYRPHAVAFLGVGAYCHAFGLRSAPWGRNPSGWPRHVSGCCRIRAD